MEFRPVADDHAVQHRFQIPQLDLHIGAVVLGDELADLLLTGDVDVVDDDLFDAAVQVGDGLVDDAVHGHHIQQLGGAVHQVGDIDRDSAQLAVGDGTLPEGVQGVLVFQAGDQGFDLVHGLDRVAVELDAVLDLQHLKLGPVRFQAVPGGLDGVEADVTVDEPAAQLAGYRRRDTAAAEKVGDQHPLVGGGFDNAFEKCFWFLGCIASRFCFICGLKH